MHKLFLIIQCFTIKVNTHVSMKWKCYISKLSPLNGTSATQAIGYDMYWRTYTMESVDLLFLLKLVLFFLLYDRLPKILNKVPSFFSVYSGNEYHKLKSRWAEKNSNNSIRKMKNMLELLQISKPLKQLRQCNICKGTFCMIFFCLFFKT